jgi:hypothetical protein
MGQPIGNPQGKDFRDYCSEEEVLAVFRLLEGFDPGWTLPDTIGWDGPTPSWFHENDPPSNWKRIAQPYAGPLDDLMAKLHACLPEARRREFEGLGMGAPDSP